MARLTLTPLSNLRVLKHQIPRHNNVPNTSIQNRPLLIYHSCYPAHTSAGQIEEHLRATKVVEPQWRYTMYSTTHFHSTTHEVLCVYSGKALLCFGGEDNPDKVEIRAEAGDVVIVPAGVGHRLLQDFGGFQMVGAYPIGKTWDMCYGKEGDEDKSAVISAVDWFSQDPLYGEKGPSIQ